MTAQRLYDLVLGSTRVFRKGELVGRKQVGKVNFVSLFGYDHTSEAPSGDNFDKVDMTFVDVVVDKARAEQCREALAEQLRDYHVGVSSYIELAPNLGMEQEGALRLMALGKTLGMWEVFEIHGSPIISGYNPS